MNEDKRKSSLDDISNSESGKVFSEHEEELTGGENSNEPGSEDVDIISYLAYVYRYLSQTSFEEVEADEVLGALQDIDDNLQYLEDSYAQPAPEGGESARQIMLEIIQNMRISVENFSIYVTREDPELIQAGVEALEEADLMLDSLRGSIAQQRLELAQILSMMEKGILKEGEPIDENLEDSFYTSNQDFKSAGQSEGGKIDGS